MKKLLSAYLSLSLALMPTLAKAETNSDSSRFQQAVQSEIDKTQNLFIQKNIRVLLTESLKEVTLEEAAKTNDFIVDAVRANIGIIRVKKEMISKNEMSLAMAVLKDIKDTSSTLTTSVTIDTSKSAEEIMTAISQSFDSLSAKNGSERQIATQEKVYQASKLIYLMKGLALYTLAIGISIVTVAEIFHFDRTSSMKLKVGYGVISAGVVIGLFKVTLDNFIDAIAD